MADNNTVEGKEIQMYDGTTPVFPKTRMPSITTEDGDTSLEAYINNAITNAIQNLKTEIGVSVSDGVVTYSKKSTFTNAVTANNANNSISGATWNS